jgi:hypothetical protein
MPSLRRAVSDGTFAFGVAVVGGAALLASLPPHPSGDDGVRRAAAIALADGHWPDVKYSLVMPAVAAVPYRVAEWFGQGDWMLDQLCVLAWVAWALFVGVRLRSLRGATEGTTIVALATVSMFAAFVTSFNAESLAAMFVSAGLLLVADPRRRWEPAVGAILAALGAAMIPVQVVALGVVGALLLWRRRQWWLIGAATAAALMVIADATKTTGELALGKYGSEESGFKEILPWGTVSQFGHPVVFGLVAILFSFGRGLLWFQPGLFLFARTPRPDPVTDWRRALTIFTFVMVPIYSAWWAWYGGVTFGPRFFLIGIVPAAVALTERLHDRSIRTRTWLAAAGLVVWTGWVAVSGALFFVTPRAFAVCVADRFRLEPLCWYSAEYSPLLAPLWDDLTADGTQWLFAVAAALTVSAVLWVARPPGLLPRRSG